MLVRTSILFVAFLAITAAMFIAATVYVCSPISLPSLRAHFDKDQKRLDQLADSYGEHSSVSRIAVDEGMDNRAEVKEVKVQLKLLGAGWIGRRDYKTIEIEYPLARCGCSWILETPRHGYDLDHLDGRALDPDDGEEGPYLLAPNWRAFRLCPR